MSRSQNERHILILPSWYKSDDLPFFASFIDEQVQAVKRQGLRVGVMYPRWNGSFSITGMFTKGKTEWRRNGDIPTLQVEVRSVVPRNLRLNVAGMWPQLRKAFDQYTGEHGVPDILHAHCVFIGGISAYHLHQKTGIPYVITEHASSMILDHDTFSPAQKEVILNVYRHARYVIAVSHFLKDKLVEKYQLDPASIRVVPNLLNNMFDKPFVPPPPAPPFLLLYMAEFSENKNHLFLLSRFKELSNSFDVKLCLIGKGVTEHKIRHLIVELGLESRVEIFGEMGRNDALSHLEKAHVLVSTSKFETFGLSILEGMAVGRPVIATDSGGPRDFMQEFNDTLTDESTFLSAVTRCLHEYSTFDGQLSRTKILERFSENAIGKQLVDVYEDVLVTQAGS
ncbi:MAG: glycosyltransferase [Flavobacteriales bacterium]|nr:glycosyltransferase [Flavobacteriales bacterium]